MSMTILFINENGSSFIDIENTTKAFNDLLEWDDFWNTPKIRIRNNDYICICADTGKMKHWKISAITMRNFFSEDMEEIQEPFIVGNIIITKLVGDDFISLDKHDIELLRTRLYKIPPKLPTGDFFRELLILD